jgi:hypothetical protein
MTKSVLALVVIAAIGLSGAALAAPKGNGQGNAYGYGQGSGAQGNDKGDIADHDNSNGRF